MVWVFVILGSLFASFFGLGALMVWASVLMLAVKASIIIIVALAVLLIVSMVSKRK